MRFPTEGEPFFGSKAAWTNRRHSHTAGRTLLFVLFGAALAIGFALLWLIHAQHLASRSPKTPPTESTVQLLSVAAERPPTPAPMPSGELARRALSTLTNVSSSGGELTGPQIETWKQNLAQLTRQRRAAVPVIREFLEQNEDIIFDNEVNRQAIEYASLRLALIDILQQIGGPDAEAAELVALQRTADPVEIAVLSRNLDRAAPGKYGEAAIRAAREALAMAGSPAWDGRDVAPLLEVLSHFAGAEAVADVQKASSTWFDYAPIVLAQLPGGAGIPALIQWTTNRDAPLFQGNDVYMRMLAETSPRHPEALATLVELAQANRIPTSSWDGIAAALAGARLQLAHSFFNPSPATVPGAQARMFHIGAGNQTFLEISPVANPSEDQRAARSRCVDQLLAVTENPFGQEALRKVKETLSAPR